MPKSSFGGFSLLFSTAFIWYPFENYSEFLQGISIRNPLQHAWELLKKLCFSFQFDFLKNSIRKLLAAPFKVFSLDFSTKSITKCLRAPLDVFLYFLIRFQWKIHYTMPGSSFGGFSLLVNTAFIWYPLENY